MAIDANSYSSVADVLTVTRHLLNGGATFDASTVPTYTEVEAFIDDVSSLLNDAIAAHGFTVPISAAGPKRSCDLWTRAKVSALVELTQRGEGFGEAEGSRYGAFWNLFDDANEFVSKSAEGWKQQGAAVTSAASDGLTFTALTIHSERTDPTVTTREQPLFRRRQFAGNL
jgi:hypothetical protein